MGIGESTLQEKQEENVTNTDEDVTEYSPEYIQKWFNCNFPVYISAQVFDLKESIIAMRRHFHKNPELSYEEYNTAKTIADYLRKLELDTVTTGVAKTGVVGLLRGDNPGPCILLRADMDALPIAEQNEVEYKSSKEGVMHACGHDCHMAILLGTAEILSKLRRHIYGSVKFVFQPAEEGGAGAKRMIDDGVLENPHVDQVYGLHVWSYAKFGTVQCRAGSLMAGSNRFRITVKGVGGHAAVPNGTKDAVVACAQLVTQLHSIVSRNISPLDNAVLTIGKMDCGYRSNVIADEGVLEGTIRFLHDGVYEELMKRVTEVCKGIDASFGVTTEVEWGSPYPPTINHKIGFDNVKFVAEQILPEGFEEIVPTMTSEDFSFFLQERPGAFFFVGCGDNGDEIHAHHKPTFQVDERCLPVGCQILTLLVLELLMTPRIDDNDELIHTITNETQSQQGIETSLTEFDENNQQDSNKTNTKIASNNAPIDNGISSKASVE